jgi:hypothetical protein
LNPTQDPLAFPPGAAPIDLLPHHEEQLLVLPAQLIWYDIAAWLASRVITTLPQATTVDVSALAPTILNNPTVKIAEVVLTTDF